MLALTFFVLAALSIVVRLVLLVRLHLTGSRNPVRDAVSDYGVGDTRRAFDTMGLAATAGWWLLALGTWFGHRDWDDRGFACLALAVAGLTTAVMRFFPTDLVGERRTARGIIHYALAITQFALTYALTGNVTRLLGDPISVVLHWVALISLIGLCVFLLPALRRKVGLFGLFERVFLVSIALFYLNYALRFVTHGL